MSVWRCHVLSPIVPFCSPSSLALPRKVFCPSVPYRDLCRCYKFLVLCGQMLRRSTNVFCFVSGCYMRHGSKSELMRGWISAGILRPCGPKLVNGKSRCGDCSLVTTARTPSLLQEQMTTSQINVATKVSSKFFRQQERCSSRHHLHK